MPAQKSIGNYASLARRRAPLLFDATEEWRTANLPLSNGYLEVSNKGRARLILIIPTIGRIVHGYRKIVVKPHHDKFLHRLVAEAFLGLCPEGRVVNHIDADKLNNRLENLEYVTPKQNVHHMMKLGRLRNGAEKRRRLTPAQVEWMRERYERGGISMEKLARGFGLSSGSIQQIIRRETYRDVK